jgi:hypothetical protein
MRCNILLYAGSIRCDSLRRRLARAATGAMWAAGDKLARAKRLA